MKLGITCLYVTHDQAEALTVADRIMVMNKGRVEQVGTPFEIYSNPRSIFVADFIGQANTLRLKLTAIDGNFATALLPGGGTVSARTEGDLAAGSEAALIVRPEQISVRDISSVESAPAAGRLGKKRAELRAKVVSATFIGSHIEYAVALEGGEIISADQPFFRGESIHAEGEEVLVSFDSEDALFLPA